MNDELIANFEENHIEIKDYNDIYEYVKTFDSDAVIMLDSSVVNYAITQNLNQNIKIEDRVNPSQLMKAMKNEIELENNRKVHIKDAVAMTKFMYWLKTNIGKEKMSEIIASDYLEKLRKAQGAIDLSLIRFLRIKSMRQ